jgi:predicted transcriptional regulator
MAKKNKVLQVNLNTSVKKRIPNNRNIRFDKNSYNLFFLIKDKETLLDIYKKSNLDKKSFYDAIKRLFREGLICVVPLKKTSQKIDMIKSNLTEYIGPIAPLIVDEIIMDFGYFNSNGNFSEQKMIYLIKEISRQIGSEQAVELKKSIEHLINKELL